MTHIDNRADVLDSRDIIEELEALESEEGALIDEYNEAKEEAGDEPTERLADAINALSSYWDLSPEEIDDAVEAMGDPGDGFKGLDELVNLKALAEQCEDCGDWLHGATLIRESYFTEYAMELAEDIGAVDRDAKWPYNHIDWEAAADALRIDYTEVDFDGVTYLIRS